MTGSSVVALNRAVAVAEAGDVAGALGLVDGLELDGYRYLHSTRAELLRRLGRDGKRGRRTSVHSRSGRRGRSGASWSGGSQPSAEASSSGGGCETDGRRGRGGAAT